MSGEGRSSTKRDLINQVSCEGFFVPRAGFEPAQALAHCPLKTACLPVPPPRQKAILLLEHHQESRREHQLIRRAEPIQQALLLQIEFLELSFLPVILSGNR